MAGTVTLMILLCRYKASLHSPHSEASTWIPTTYQSGAPNIDSSASKLSNPHESLQSLEESGLSKVGIFLAGFDLVRQEPAGDLELFRLRAHRASVWVGLELPHI